MIFKNNNNARALLEYVVLVVITLGALYVLRDYMSRGIGGHMKQTGDSFGFGRQYDAAKTVDCAYDDIINKWYDVNCFEDQVIKRKCKIGDVACEQKILSSAGNNLCVTGVCKDFNPKVIK